ncbi:MULTISPECIES: acyl carrier protein [unclassified Lentimonas]|uniref:acyl carrier protein n=1 Tax=unclassified Lentimonas TaxID=2630993 RepID=UPI0013266671|nr:MULTISPECIES: acyl carrier protein [unclassified Lentimonas]CAA6694163.1 Unannotated [Lentimonas sp. CC10]CAA6694337.1 Unannotated [Lentimonas sp. CC19]CAA7071092.1 Unannotated [Lentimonas sp. CC11]
MQTLIRLQPIFRDILDDDTLQLTEDFSVNDCVDWDSVATVQIVLAVEEAFDVRLPTDVVGNLKSVRQLLAHLPV